MSRIGRSSRPVTDWTSNPWHPTVTDWTSNPWLGLAIQSVTVRCHGLDVQSKSRVGHPIRGWDWMILKSVQSQSRIGRPIQVMDWTSNPWLAWMIVQSVTYVCHGLDTVQSVAVWTIVNSSFFVDPIRLTHIHKKYHRYTESRVFYKKGQPQIIRWKKVGKKDLRGIWPINSVLIRYNKFSLLYISILWYTTMITHFKVFFYQIIIF